MRSSTTETGQEAFVPQHVDHPLGEVCIRRAIRRTQRFDADEQAMTTHVADRVACTLTLAQRRVLLDADRGDVGAQIEALNLIQHGHTNGGLDTIQLNCERVGHPSACPGYLPSPEL